MSSTKPPRKKQNAASLTVLVSFVFHAIVVGVLAYFAAREGLLGKQLKKIAVEMVKEKPREPDKPKEPEKPKEEPPKVEEPKMAETPRLEEPKLVPPPAVVSAQPVAAAPPAVAPAAVDVPSFVFDGGKAVQTTSDPLQIYKGAVEYALRSRWNRPDDMNDKLFVAEVEVAVDRTGEISNPVWKKSSGNKRWDDSVREAIAATKTTNRSPPANFPPRVLVRFDVQEVVEELSPLSR